MNLTLHWSTKAIQDLDKIYSYYSKGNEKAAVDLYNAIRTIMFFSGDGSNRTFIGKLPETVPGTYSQEKFQDHILHKESHDLPCCHLGLPAKYKKTLETI